MDQAVPYVVRITNRGAYDGKDAASLAVLDTALARWRSESGGAITSFTRVPETRDAVLEGTACQSGSAVWNQVAGVWPGVDFGDGSGNHLLVMQPQGCGGGVGTVGDSINDGGRITFDAYPAKINSTFLHEIGHNFGLGHAHAEVCSPTCTQVEYGNYYTPMGASLIGQATPPSFDSFERARLQITQGCEVPALALTPGRRSVTASYDLWGRGTASGARGLRVTDPVDGAEYWVEWRNLAGADSGAAHPAFGYAPGITVQQLDTDATTTVLQTIRVSDDESVFALETGEAWAAAGVRVQAGAVPAPGRATSTSQVSITLTDTAGSDAALPAQRGAAAVAGLAVVGARLSAQPRSWTPGACFRYQWLGDGRPIAGARTPTFTVPAALRGHRISVRVTGQRSGFAARTVTSPAQVVGRFTSAPRPVVRGVAQVGRVLRADPRLAAWSPRPTAFRYAWYAGGKRIAGATRVNLRLTRKQARKRVEVRVTGTRSGFAAVTARSVLTGRVRR